MIKRIVALLAVMTMVRFMPPLATRTEAAINPNAGDAVERGTPPRLSFIQGEVSFWRPGANDWAAARINTALAAGDNLYTGAAANLEVQVGPMAFLRAGEQTQLGLEDLEPDFLQLKVTSGHAALVVRRLDSGHTVELDTPNAAVTIERAGYYRVDITADSTTLICRRGGQATVTPAGGASLEVTGNQEVIIQGTATPQVATYEAPKLDDWDRWNYDRTDSLLASGSGTYVPADMYGSQELSRYGTWENADPYGEVWAPTDVGPTWAPYSTGDWMWDTYYGSTWVDEAPWGWAPYHYGRWVYWHNCWAWAPGPVAVNPVWEPALVGFVGFPGFSIGVGFGTPIGWAALGWGEPLIPWWGGAGFIGVPCWHGWYGPRYVNNVFVNRRTFVNVDHMQFANIHAPHGLVAIPRDRFGNGPAERGRIGNILQLAGARHLQPLHGPLPVRAGPQSLVAAAGRGLRPPASVMERSVVATRAARLPTVTRDPAAARLASAVNPPPRLVPAVQRGMAATTSGNLQRDPTTFQSANARSFAAPPNRSAGTRGPMNAMTRFAPPPLPHSGVMVPRAPSQQHVIQGGNSAFASRSAPPSSHPLGSAGTFSVVNSPRVPRPQPPALQQQRVFSPRQAPQPSLPRFASAPAPRVQAPRFSAPAAPRFAAPRAPAVRANFGAPRGPGGGHVGGGGGAFRGGRGFAHR